MVGRLLDDYARQGGTVIGPQAKGPQFAFAPIADPAELRLDYDTSILPPKVVLQPPREQIAVFFLLFHITNSNKASRHKFLLFDRLTCLLHEPGKILERADLKNNRVAFLFSW